MIKYNNRKILFIIFGITFSISIIYILLYFFSLYKDKNDLIEVQKYMSSNNILDSDEINIVDNIEINENYTSQEKINVDEDILKLQEIQKSNSNIVAWIKIEGTNINYPILQGENNEYYLSKNYKDEYSKNGSIFLDYRYDFSKDNCNFLVYGHNNRNKLMFSELLEYENESFFANHKKINIITENENKNYNIISVFKSQVFNKSDIGVFRYYDCIEFPNEETYYDYIKKCKEKSLYDINIEPTYGDEILTLSTCEYSNENGRFVVVAVKEK